MSRDNSIADINSEIISCLALFKFCIKLLCQVNILFGINGNYLSERSFFIKDEYTCNNHYWLYE